MYTHLRACFIPVKGYFDLRSDQDADPRNNRIMQRFVMFPHVNWTYVPSDGEGDLQDTVTLRYSGCIGSVQENMSDTGFFFPRLDDLGPDVRFLTPVMYDRPVIGTVYHKLSSTDGYATRVLEFVSALSPSCWFMTWITMLILLMYPCLRQVVLSGRWQWRRLLSRCLKELLACALKQHSSCSIRRRHSGSCSYFLLNILCFLTILLLTCMIKTDMVIVNPPVTYNTYQDLLDNHTIPFWISELNDQQPFQKSAPVTTARLLYDAAVRRGLHHSMMFATQMMGVDSADVLQKKISMIIDRTAVGISSRVAVLLTASNACAAIRSTGTFDNVNLLTRVDPSTPEIQRFFIMSHHVDDAVRRKIGQRFKHIMQMDTFVSSVLHEYKYYMTTAMLKIPIKSHRQIEECTSNVIMKPYHDVTSVACRGWSLRGSVRQH